MGKRRKGLWLPLKLQLYNSLVRLSRLKEINAPDVIIAEDEAFIESLKARINRRPWADKTDRRSVEEIEAFVEKRIKERKTCNRY